MRGTIGTGSRQSRELRRPRQSLTLQLRWFYAFSPRPGGRDAGRHRQRAHPVGPGALGLSLRRRGLPGDPRPLGSTVEYQKLDALELDRLDERFDFIFCCGIPHRVEAPASTAAAPQPSGGGRSGAGSRRTVPSRDPSDGHPRHRYAPWGGLLPGRLRLLGFTAGGIEILGRESGPGNSSSSTHSVIDGHPRSSAGCGAERLLACFTGSLLRFAGISHPRAPASVILTMTVAGDLIAHRLGRAYGPDNSETALRRSPPDRSMGLRPTSA